MTKNFDKYWQGSKPKACDLCKQPFKTIFYDSRTKQGPWSLLCHACFLEYGMGLGLGYGQSYDLESLKKLGG